MMPTSQNENNFKNEGGLKAKTSQNMKKAQLCLLNCNNIQVWLWGLHSIKEWGQLEALPQQDQRLQGPGLPLPHSLVQQGPHSYCLRAFMGAQAARLCWVRVQKWIPGELRSIYCPIIQCVDTKFNLISTWVWKHLFLAKGLKDSLKIIFSWSQALRKQCQDFATALLDHTRSSYELEVLLNYDPDGPAYQVNTISNTLKLAGNTAWLGKRTQYRSLFVSIRELSGDINTMI